MGIAGVSLDVEEAFSAGAPGLVDHANRLAHRVVLLDDALNHARHLVGPAARACGDDELDRLRGFPGNRRDRHTRYCQAGTRREGEANSSAPDPYHSCLLTLPGSTDDIDVPGGGTPCAFCGCGRRHPRRRSQLPAGVWYT